MKEGPDFLICAESISLALGRRHILRNINFEARSGEAVAIVGRNGAGKSTLLNVLAKRLSPDCGSVFVAASGKKVADRTFRSLVALLPHEPFLYPELSARENLLFFASLYEIHGRKAVVSEALERVGLQADGDRPVRTLSRGMLQRAAVGRLIVCGARIWLLDEPSTGLDEQGRQWLRETILVHVRLGGIAVFASHDPEEVGLVSTRVVALSGGRAIAQLSGGLEGAKAAFETLKQYT